MKNLCTLRPGLTIAHLRPDRYWCGTKMKYIAAYLLLVQAGNTSPSAADVTKVLESVGIEVESEKLDKLIAEVEGKSVEELIAEGTEKMSSVPTGAPAAAAASGAAAGAPEAAAEEAAAEEEEEEDDDMGFGLFD
ncbi:hypothetical protein KL921_001327 [Ogataea angusta]|uniref:60S acidic ribosomal protein P2 n=1 Tax=Pichia angusta TaxID=870730 RepID=A0AAN6DGN6_PICAN|nr:uncharacterized protein KL928_002564 [Ogataea angusta]KAG7812095.1 hypothetical protein KL921_001327 [Ogataea angusta]KAG7818696.1 hypothetical protein KL928_002564 [Ogataea angusta]KAG7862084.1 hypothetical protein KL939_001105 [Ogataea angusta]